MLVKWAIVAWRVAILLALIWIGFNLNNIASMTYTGPSRYDDHAVAMDKIRQSIDEMHKTLLDIEKYGAGWRK